MKLDKIFEQIKPEKQKILSRIQSFDIKKIAQNYKNHLLKMAFDGTLTNEEKGADGIPKGWKLTSLGDITIKSQNGKTGKPSDDSSQIPRLGITSVTGSETIVDENNHKFQKISKKDIQTYQIEKNDILVCRQNGNRNFVGKFAIYEGNRTPLIFSDSLIRFKINDEILPRYVVMFMNSPLGRTQISSYCKTTAGNLSVNGTHLKLIEIPYPKKNIQLKIVKILDQKFTEWEVCKLELQKIQQRNESIKKNLENLESSILNVAFSGKLSD